MREGWEIKKLGEAFQIKPPKSEARETLLPADAVSFVPMEDLGVLTKAINVVKERKLEDVAGSYTYFGENDVLLAKITPCFENGKLGIAKNLLNEVGFGSSEFIVFRSKSIVISEYLFYFLSRDEFRQEGKKRMTGAVGHKRVSKDWIENYPLPFPRSKSEQQRIVSILDEAFAAIDKAKANLQKNLSNAKELFQSELNRIFSQKGEGWEDTKLGEVCVGFQYGTSAKSKNAGKVPVLGMGNIQDGQIVWDRLVYATDEKEIEKYLLRSNDVLFNRTNSTELVGKSAIYKSERPAIFAGYLIRIVRKEDQLDADFLNYYLNSDKTRAYGFSVMISSVSQANISSSKLKEYPIRLPGIETQRRVVNQLDALHRQTKKLENLYRQKLSYLEALKRSILQKAFSGELTKPVLLDEAAA